MSVSDESSSKKKNTSEIVQELLALKSKISELPQKYPTGTFTFGSGVGEAQKQIPTICAVIDDAVKALEKGLDVHNRPITNSQIADGVKRLVIATRAPAFVGLMTAVLNSEGVRVLETYMNELEQIVSTIAGTAAEQKYTPAKGREKKGTIKYCPKCGAPVKEDSLFCENCGSKLSKGEPEEKKTLHNEAKAHYDRGIQLCQEYMWKGGIGDGAYVAIRRAMEEFKIAFKLSPNVQLARLALADCYFCCPNNFSSEPFDAAILYQESIKNSPDLVIDKEQALLGDKYMKEGPSKGYEAAVAYRKAMKREPVIWR